MSLGEELPALRADETQFVNHLYLDIFVFPNSVKSESVSRGFPAINLLPEQFSELRCYYFESQPSIPFPAINSELEGLVKGTT